MPGAGETARAPQERDVLRFLTCGSVDDGKSTLIGRLLYDTKLILDDQLSALKRESAKFGTAGDNIDFALLLDGLEAEREQGITIDVAHRFFATGRRAFIVADTPGHEQYTRNMATGASNCDLAVLLVDATRGLLDQTRRHSTICSLFGIREVVLAVNKIDLVGYGENAFAAIVAAYMQFCSALNFRMVAPIPISARHGDNVVGRSAATPWYAGPSLLEHLETVDVAAGAEARPFRFAVQWVNRPNSDFRGYSGTVGSGTIRRGDLIRAATRGATSRVADIVTAAGTLPEARAGDAITLVLEDDIDLARGDVLARPEALPEMSDQFSAHILWMGDEPLLAGRRYLMRIGNQWTSAVVSTIKHMLDVRNLAKHAARRLELNDIGYCNVSTSVPVAFDPYAQDRGAGAFILVDGTNHQTVAAGMIEFGLRRAANLRPERLAVDKEARASLKHQRPCILWFTGLPGSGKSTIAKALEAKLHAAGHHTYMLDGDNLRLGLNRDLGFTDTDRVENIRRAGEIARLFVDAGLIVICAFISPFRSDREFVRNLCGTDEFFELFVGTSIEECMRRDPKGHYAKAKDGLLKNFTGVDSPYETPERPDLTLDTTAHPAEELADQVIVRLRLAGRIS